MTVLWKNKLFDLNLSFRVFESWKHTSPQMVVEVEQLTQSTYKENVKVPIGELEDWSVYRNTQALVI